MEWPFVAFSQARAETVEGALRIGPAGPLPRRPVLLYGALEKAMLDYLDQRNENPKPFVWTADADLILGKVQRLSKRISRSGH